MDAFALSCALTFSGALVALRYFSPPRRLRRVVARLRQDLLVALESGAVLDAIGVQLHNATKWARNARPPGRKYDRPRQTRDELELRLLYAVAAMEQLDFATAADHIAVAQEHRLHALVALRLGLLLGERSTAPAIVFPKEHALWLLLADDAGAQMNLAAAHTRMLPTTRARVLAAKGDGVAAVATLAALAPSRRDAMLRAFPGDAATAAWLLEQRGPYR